MNYTKNWVSSLMRSYRITFLLILIAFGLGIVGFKNMAKAEFPDFVIRQGVVVAVYPGATAEEVEEQVAKPLERYLFTFDEVKREKTTTTSSNGMCVCMVELQDDVTDKDIVWSKIKHGLNTFKSMQLPSGVLALQVNDDFGSASALLIALESENHSYRELKGYADDLSDELRRIESVSNVNISGASPEQITIYIDQQRLSAYGIGQMAVMNALQSAGFTTMAGSISGQRKDVPIHVRNDLSSEADVENLIIYSDTQNHVVRLKDIATVKREYDLTSSYIEFQGSKGSIASGDAGSNGSKVQGSNAHPCVLLSLEMIQGNNIVQYGKDVQKVLTEFKDSELPSDVNINTIADQTKVVEDSVADFMLNLIESMVIIIVVMLALFPWRTAVVAGVTVPLSTFISVFVMYMIGIPLNTVTLAGLILVLGMIVDNAIVVLDGYLEYINKGMSRWHAAAESARHYFMPMTLATMCIAVIFFPFLFTMKGQMYDFIEWLPWTIFINLAVSLMLAVVLIPVLEFMLIKYKARPDKRVRKGFKRFKRFKRVQKVQGRKQRKTMTDYIQQYYEKVLAWIFRHPWITIGSAISLVVATLVLIAPNLKVRMMPVAERNQFAVEVTLPVGAGLNETKAIADSVANALSKEDDVVSVTTFMGCSSPRFHTAYAPKIAGRNYAQMIVNTTSNEATVLLLDKYEPLYSERFPKAFVKMKQLDFQNFSPFEYRFYGQNEDSLRVVAEQLTTELSKHPDLMNIHTDWDDARPLIEVAMDPVRSQQLGLNRMNTQLQLALGTGSIGVGEVWEDGYRVPLVVKDIQGDNLDCDGVNNMFLTSPIVNASGVTGGQTAVPLRQIGEAKPVWKATNICHRGGERCITVSCDLKRNILPAPIHKQMQTLIKEKIHLPEGVRYEVGGEPENDAEVSGYMGIGLSIAIGIIFFFVLFNFRRYKMAIACLVALVLIVPGTLIGLSLMGRAVGVTCIFGLIALMGMLMRNEILIFEHADDMVRKGMSVRDAAFDAGRRRMVPIFLTTATTAVGVVPMILAATSFWMPVGVSIFAGGIASLILVVTVLPVVYWKLNSPLPTSHSRGGDKNVS